VQQVTDPEAYRTIFENERVRVLERVASRRSDAPGTPWSMPPASSWRPA
jgi:hypothetical protein